MKRRTHPHVEFKGLVERLGPVFGYNRGFDYGSVFITPGLNIDKLNHELKFMTKHVNMLKDKKFDDILAKMAVYEIPGFAISAAANITADGADLAGQVFLNRVVNVVEIGFVLHTSANPTIANTKISTSKTDLTPSHTLTGLTAETQYYVKVFVTTKFGTYYGSQITFTTLAA